ncbi:MAG: hypothetical protein M1819_000175 [Sarea resinae]|nr:MAG: hypothetical protein M1819_000175 [Sarea resinae]
MAKTRPSKKEKKRERSVLNGTTGPIQKSPPTESPESLLAEATALLQTSQPEQALELAERALALLQPASTPTVASLPALSILAETHLELGDVEGARERFLTAVSLDPAGEIPEEAGGGAEKFLYLAQLCEEGGAESVQWFEKGAAALRRDIAALEGKKAEPEEEYMAEEKKRKLANALCGVAEVYMTDLSWEEDAEARCEALVTEALLVAPNTPEPLQTLASVRISQERGEDARAALSRSMELWKDLPPEDPHVPDFPTRVSLARLLMETEMEDEAIEVLERLVGEDDSSVETWYLGGWCLYLMGQKRKDAAPTSSSSHDGDDWTALLVASREWLQNSLKLYNALEYEDERLRDHAVELVNGLDGELGPVGEEGDDDGEIGDDWEDEDDDDDDDDERMEGT